MARQVPWLRIVAEGVAIIVSILLAFGIQAWWDARSDDIAEMEYLTAIRDEVGRNLSALDGNEGIARRVGDALKSAERLLATGQHTDSASAFVSALLTGAISAGPPRISTAVFDDLTSTGRLVVIRDLAIRRAVLELYAQIDVNMERMQRRADATDVRLYAVVARHIPPGAVRRDDDFLIGVGLDPAALSSDELRRLAGQIGFDPQVREELRAAFVEQEDETVYRVRYRQRLMDAMALLEEGSG